ncbi:uncharacterized protein LOC108234168 [Kryptolebias marmoratus]|uniref:uncharacterized protein LOC108234168 n=1 Tax=Kryptolebias marmoratus TaxID=37003 RepID=UPI0018ACEF94|nr:uncharacterized protein LOC108234168 [Kryptolebias marmoratus]
MKSFSVAVAVAVVLTIICLQETSAAALVENQEMTDAVNPDISIPVYYDIPEDSWKMPYDKLRRRCRFCCGCCPGMRGCGLCCRSAKVSIKTRTFSIFSHQTGEDHQNPNFSLSKSPKMNSFTVAVAVAVMLTSICLQESSAVPLTEEHELVEAMTDDSPVAAHEEIPEESWNMPYEAMEMRRRRRRCRFCCGCCPNMVGCGTCCKF